MYKIMTAGPTQVRENVRIARSIETTNPDLDKEFYHYYKETCDLFKKFLNCTGEAYILSGEAILGLEAACASLTEPGDRVLVLDNGLYGKYFADFVKIYGGVPVMLESDYHKEFDINILKNYLEKDSNFKYATVVHSDTPSSVLNDVETICNILSEYNILSVVDSVSGMFGEKLDIDKGKIDILCGGSQKALSAPPGLTILFVSHKAIKSMEERKTPIASFYGNILNFKNYYKDLWFPYTMPISDIYGLRTALDNILEDKEIFSRHEKIAEATRYAVRESGLKLYLNSGFSNTVTAIEVPENLTADQILDTVRDKYNIFLSVCFDILAGKIFRIGHMGENANYNDMVETMDALDKTFSDLNYKLQNSLKEKFIEKYNQL